MWRESGAARTAMPLVVTLEEAPSVRAIFSWAAVAGIWHAGGLRDTSGSRARELWWGRVVGK